MLPRLFLTGFQFAPLIRSGGKEGDNHATERINFFETSHGDCEHLQMGLDQYITWTFQWMAKKSLHKFKRREGDSERSWQWLILKYGKMSGWHLANIMSNKYKDEISYKFKYKCKYKYKYTYKYK